MSFSLTRLERTIGWLTLNLAAEQESVHALSLGVAGTLQRDQAEVANCSNVGLSLSPAQGHLHGCLHSIFLTLSIKRVRYTSIKMAENSYP